MTHASWHDAYQDLWSQAAQSRGTVSHVGAQHDTANHHPIREWPRTTMADVLTVAAVVDPILAALPLRSGGYGIARRWQLSLVQMDELAFLPATIEYPHNRAWWSTLLAIAAYLDTVGAPPPSDDAWDDVLASVWSPIDGYRNADAPTTRVITTSSIEKMWDAQHDELVNTRGFDMRETPLGELGRPMKVPRTTNADVLRLVDYWSKQFNALKLKVMLGQLVNPMGFDGEQARWQAATLDVDKYARPGKPDEIYVKNHELWRAMLSLATTLAVLGEAPTSFDLMVEATKQAVVDLPERVAHAAGTAANAIGDVAHQVGAGLLGGLGKPLLIGGSTLVALYLLLRNRPREAAQA